MSDQSTFTANFFITVMSTIAMSIFLDEIKANKLIKSFLPPLVLLSFCSYFFIIPFVKDIVESSKSSPRYQSQNKESNYYSNNEEYYDDEVRTGSSGYHYTSGYTRSDGTEVHGYVKGNPDGVTENNIEYMRDNGEYNALTNAYESAE